MADLGLGFDCASYSEIQAVLDLGVDPSRIIFSHPCKAVSALRMASDRGVLMATFDNADELEKIRDVSPDMRLMLRIYAQDDTARVCLGRKFGAPLHTTHALLSKARQLGLEVVGISFHIGMSPVFLSPKPRFSPTTTTTTLPYAPPLSLPLSQHL